MTAFSTDKWETESAVNRCENLVSVLAKGLITFDEYVATFAGTAVLVRVPDMANCVATIPTQYLEEFRESLGDFLRPSDFMPSQIAGCLLAPYSDEDLQAAKRAFRPKYIRLLELVESRSASQAKLTARRDG
jgi:hypothetical protein